MERIKASISVKFSDSKTAKDFFISLEPETLKSFSDRSRISMKQEDDSIQFQIDAKDITAFRATLNSYLIWMRVLSTITPLCETQK